MGVRSTGVVISASRSCSLQTKTTSCLFALCTAYGLAVVLVWFMLFGWGLVCNFRRFA